jgi:uncharacterized membrane protein HdeD (DUF308 family)
MLKRHRFADHSPSEMRELSNLAHVMEGTLFLVIGILALAGNTAGLDWASVTWPALAILAGVGLLVVLYPLHPTDDWRLIWQDHQQRQHTIMAAALVFGGTLEYASRARLWLEFAWPAALLLIGVLFVVHTQHGTGAAVRKATRQHRVLGATIIAAAIFAGVAVVETGQLFATLSPMAIPFMPSSKARQ